MHGQRVRVPDHRLAVDGGANEEALDIAESRQTDADEVGVVRQVPVVPRPGRAGGRHRAGGAESRLDDDVGGYGRRRAPKKRHEQVERVGALQLEQGQRLLRRAALRHRSRHDLLLAGRPRPAAVALAGHMLADLVGGVGCFVGQRGPTPQRGQQIRLDVPRQRRGAPARPASRAACSWVGLRTLETTLNGYFMYHVLPALKRP